VPADALVSVIVPTFREARALPALIAAVAPVRESLRTAGRDLELWLMDDPSGDGSESVVAAIGHAWVHYVPRTGPRGLSLAVLDGFSRARGHTLVVMDADLSHPPAAILSMLERLASGAEMVIASRYVPGGSTDADWGLKRWITSKGAMALARPLAKLTDPLAGFFALPRATLERAPGLSPIGWKIGLEVVVRCRPARIDEVPIHFKDRAEGESKLNARECWRYLRHLARLYAFRLGLSPSAAPGMWTLSSQAGSSSLPRHARA
jgi:dolichol-phosphate mannosyltransferase